MLHFYSFQPYLEKLKLSDNYAKAIGSRDEVEYYKNVFGDHKLADQKVVV